MEWNEPTAETRQDFVGVELTDTGSYPIAFQITNPPDGLTMRFGAVVTKLLEAKITLRNSAGRELFKGTLFELSLERLRSVGIGSREK